MVITQNVYCFSQLHAGSMCRNDLSIYGMHTCAHTKFGYALHPCIQVQVNMTIKLKRPTRDI